MGTPHPLNRREEDLSDQLVAAWTNFAWTGNPNGLGNSPWPRYKPNNNGRILVEDIPNLATETDAFWVAEHQCNFWDNVLVFQSTVQ